MSVREHLVYPIWKTQEGGVQETPEWGSVSGVPPAAGSSHLAASQILLMVCVHLE